MEFCTFYLLTLVDGWSKGYPSWFLSRGIPFSSSNLLGSQTWDLPVNGVGWVGEQLRSTKFRIPWVLSSKICIYLWCCYWLRVILKHIYASFLTTWDVPLDFLWGIFDTLDHLLYYQWLYIRWTVINLLILVKFPFKRFWLDWALRDAVKLWYYEMKTCLKGNAFFFKQTELIWLVEKCALHTLELFFSSLTSIPSLLTHTCCPSGVFGRLKRLNLGLSALFPQVLTQQ